jgi:hypothetical protein
MLGLDAADPLNMFRSTRKIIVSGPYLSRNFTVAPPADYPFAGSLSDRDVGRKPYHVVGNWRVAQPRTTERYND